MATLHQKLAVVIVLGSLLGTIWAAYATYKAHELGRLVVASWVGVAALLAQAVMGTVLGFTGTRPADGSHFIFGPLTLLALPVTLWMARDRQGRVAPALLLTGWVVTLVLSLRATGTGGLA